MLDMINGYLDYLVQTTKNISCYQIFVNITSWLERWVALCKQVCITVDLSSNTIPSYKGVVENREPFTGPDSLVSKTRFSSPSKLYQSLTTPHLTTDETAL